MRESNDGNTVHDPLDKTGNNEVPNQAITMHKTESYDRNQLKKKEKN